VSLGGTITWTDDAGVTHLHCARHEIRLRWSIKEQPKTCPHCEAEKAKGEEAPMKETTVITDDERVTRVKPEQTSLEGIEQKRLKDVEKAADEYDDVKKRWMALGEEVQQANEKIRKLLHAHMSEIDSQLKDGVLTLAYTRGEYKIIVTTAEKLKVKIKDEDEDED
jgi:hypothetical protein